MGKIQDKLKRKLIDNAISLMGVPTDCVQVRTKKSKVGDVQTRIVEEAKVLPFVFPPMVDVPFRRMIKGTSKTWKMESLPAADELFPIEIMTTHYGEVYIDDLIFRVILEPDVENPLVLCLQVVEMKGTFGAQSLLYGKLGCVYYNQALPSEVLETIDAVARRRQALGW